MEFNHEHIPSLTKRPVLICQRNTCWRGVYTRSRTFLLPHLGKNMSVRLLEWWCHSGHQQDPDQLTYTTDGLREIDHTVTNPVHWSTHYFLETIGYEGVYQFANEISLAEEDLDEADWQPFYGDAQPESNWTPHHIHEIYRVTTNKGNWFFWLAFQDEEYRQPLYHWQPDAGETLNGRVIIARNAEGHILGMMIGTQPGGLTGSVASARRYLRLQRGADRVEVHKYQGCHYPYDGKPLAVVTLDDLADNERASQGR